MSLMFPAVMLIMNATSVAVVWFGGRRVDAGDMQVGALIAFLSYIMYILMAVMLSTMMFVMVPRAVVASERITAVLDTEPSVRPPTHPRRLASANGAPRNGVATADLAGATAAVGAAGPAGAARAAGAAGSGVVRGALPTADGHSRVDGTGPGDRVARGHLELRDVDFRYPGAEASVLHGVSLTARAGPHDGDHRRHRLGQDHASSTSCPGCSR